MPWLPADFVHPEQADLPTGHHLRPIRESDVDLDHPAVMGSRRRLWTIYGDAWGWPPESMTFEQDRADLAHHAQEIAAHLSFNFAVFDEAETRLLGCVYIDPDEALAPGDEPAGAALVSWWVVDEMVGSDLDRALERWVPEWLASAWPFATVRYAVK